MQFFYVYLFNINFWTKTNLKTIDQMNFLQAIPSKYQKQTKECFLRVHFIIFIPAQKLSNLSLLNVQLESN